jgi:hypothetical protein
MFTEVNVFCISGFLPPNAGHKAAAKPLILSAPVITPSYVMGVHWIEPINYWLQFDVHQKLHGQIRYTEHRKMNVVVSLGLVYFIQNFNTRNEFPVYVRVR